MKKSRLWFYRILIACLFGSAVTYLSLDAGRKQSEILVAREQNVNKSSFQNLNTVIDSYQQVEYKLPPDLNTLVSKGYVDKGWVYDTWNHPFLYRVEGKHYIITTYGRDGKPGGTGMDADQTSDNPSPKNREMTFEQFLSYPEARDMVNWAIMGGIVATLLCGFLVQPVTLKKENLLPAMLGLLLLLVVLAGVTTVITVLHIPSGH